MWCRPLHGLNLGVSLLPTASAVGYYVSPTPWVRVIIAVDDGGRILVMWCRPLRGLILGMVLLPTAVAVGYYVSPTSWVCGRVQDPPLH